MAYTMPSIFKISVSAACPTHARTEVSARQHTLIIDEPPNREGTDLAPSPLETMLGSYLGCTNVIANVLAEEMGFEITSLSLALTGHFDSRGVFGKADVEVPFPEIDLTVDIATTGTAEQVMELKAALTKRCPVSVILRQAGSVINETWNVGPAV